MAIMYPRQPKSNTLSQAELTLFNTFAKYLSDDYTVFHSVDIQMPRRSSGVDDYEIDFVIAHPKQGVLLLEVKGGLIRYDGAMGWSRQNRGSWLSFDSPVDQVKGASYQLFKYLSNQPATKSFNYASWYAVALPDVDIEQDITPGIRQEIILDKKSLHPSRIEETIGRLFAYYQRSDSRKAPGKAGIKALGSVLAPQWFLTSFMSTDFEYEESAIKELTEEQFNVLDGIDFRKRALIAGCAGSGKTLLAVEMARRFAEDGQRVLLTCYNRALAEYLSESPVASRMMIKHFHSLAYHVFKTADNAALWRELMEEERSDEENSSFWTDTLPDHMMSLADGLPATEKFDAIVVDEGQDFRATYWLPIQMLLKEPDEGTLYIFYDEAQRIYSLDEFPIQHGPHAMLRKNLRSTRPIGEFIAPYYPGKDKFIPAGADSKQDVWIIDPTKYDSEAAVLNDILQTLTDEHLMLRDIAILTMASEERSQWSQGQVLADGYDLRWLNSGHKIQGKRVLVSTIQGFKGLERPVIILTELDKASREEQVGMLIYIGMSRAKNLLIILGDKPQLPHHAQ
ncbi:MAG: NERD domain-containing protein [Chloroflexi bacterium]|nr:NERD domain-containing protein [Chloroflexota bacterium]